LFFCPAAFLVRKKIQLLQAFNCCFDSCTSKESEGEFQQLHCLLSFFLSFGLLLRERFGKWFFAEIELKSSFSETFFRRHKNNGVEESSFFPREKNGDIDMHDSVEQQLALCSRVSGEGNEQVK
jgi:hypothetical protein